MDPVINFSMGFDCCAIVICVVIMANYYSVKHISTRTEKLFQVLMGTLLVSAAANLVNVSFGYVEGMPAWLSYAAGMLMVISVHSAGISFMLYVVSECYQNRPFPRTLTAFAVIIIVLVGTAVALYGFRNSLPEGAAQTIIVCMFAEHCCAIAVAAACVVVNRRALDVRTQVNIFIYIAFNVIATIVQAFTRAQITAFAQSVAVMLIFATLRNPKDEIDALTKTFSKQAFRDFILRQISARRTFRLFMMGIRNMPAINALWGQNADDVIKETAARIVGITDKNTYVYRTDEARFAAVFSSDAQFEKFRERYRKIIGQPYFVGQYAVPVDHVAVLIAFPEAATKFSDIESIIKYYRGHYSGGDEVIIATRDAVADVVRREKVDYAIQKALRLHSFQVCYQPIFDLKAKKFNCCEALVRLYDDEIGYIPPNEFIPIAESNGTIVDVGREVMTQVCKFICGSRPQELGVEFIDVNLSIIQCMLPEVLDNIRSILHHYGVPRGMVNLEITETASARSYDTLQRHLNELRSNGFAISLDDFGTGFSSVEFLIKFPFDIVKLDRSLVRAYMETKKYEPILQHYMPMLHSLGTKIVAEGVETEEMVKALDALGCDYLQGYYYSKPLPEDEYLAFLAAHSGADLSHGA